MPADWYSQMFVPASQLTLAAQGPAFVWQRGIPSVGAPGIQVAGAGGVAGCANLLGQNPAALTEQYEIYAIAIGWTVHATFSSTPATAPTIDAELAFLVGGRTAYVNTDTVVANLGDLSALATSAWTADLVNPLVVSQRDTLALRAGARVSQSITGGSIYVGIQAIYANPDLVVPVAFESTISHRIVDRRTLGAHA